MPTTNHLNDRASDRPLSMMTIRNRLAAARRIATDLQSTWGTAGALPRPVARHVGQARELIARAPVALIDVVRAYSKYAATSGSGTVTWHAYQTLIAVAAERAAGRHNDRDRYWALLVAAAAAAHAELKTHRASAPRRAGLATAWESALANLDSAITTSSVIATLARTAQARVDLMHAGRSPGVVRAAHALDEIEELRP